MPGPPAARLEDGSHGDVIVAGHAFIQNFAVATTTRRRDTIRPSPLLCAFDEITSMI